MVYNELKKHIEKQNAPKKSDFLDIGGVILSFMEERKLGGAELARLSGVSESEVYNVLKNRRSRSGLKTLEKLTTPLGKTLADIFNKLSQEKESNATKYEKDPSFVMEFRKQAFTVFSDTAPAPDFFIGRISLLGGGKGLVSQGLKDNCSFFLRVLRGNIEVKYCDTAHLLSTYQKLVFNGRFPHSIKNKSETEAAETLIVTTPSMWLLAPAQRNPL